MTAEKLAARYDVGLEHDRRYDTALRTFCALLLRPGTRVAGLRDFLHHELPAGQPDTAMVMFVEAAARQLGRQWVNDDCDFVDVTIGSARLQELIRRLSFDFRSRRPLSWMPCVALVTPAGEQHTLAQHILGLLFDAMGWNNLILEGEALEGAAFHAAIARADMVCIGWSNLRLKQEFADMIRSIRAVAPDTKMPIVAGGLAALDSVDFLVSLGIDCICDSVYSASRICEKFCELEAIGHKVNVSGPRIVVDAGRPDWLSQ